MARRAVVGVIGNAHLVENRFAVQHVGERNLRAVAEVYAKAVRGQDSRYTDWCELA